MSSQFPAVNIGLPEDLQPLTYQEAAGLLKVCKKTVENLCRASKKIPLTYIGHSPRILFGDLKRYIVSSRNVPTSTDKPGTLPTQSKENPSNGNAG